MPEFVTRIEVRHAAEDFVNAAEAAVDMAALLVHHGYDPRLGATLLAEMVDDVGKTGSGDGDG